MKRIIVVLLVLFIAATGYTQDGILFSHGSWKETLEQARQQHKLIFIDVYTSWCGPCKKMAQEVFPLPKTGALFNSHFINYKIDAEKGEGIAIAQTYGANAYPTYLFVDGNGTLFYRSLGAMSEEKFLQEAGNALIEFKDPKPLPVWDAEFPARKNDKAFLFQYLQKRQKLRLPSEEVLDQLVSLSSKEELMQQEWLSLLVKAETAKVDGPFYQWMAANITDIEKQAALQPGYLAYKLSRFIATDLHRAAELNSTALLEQLIAARKALPSELPMDWEINDLQMRFYTQTANEPKLEKVLYRYSKSMMDYDRSKLKEPEAQKKMAGIMYAYRVRSIAEAALKASNNKKVLEDALQWMQLAAEYSDNFTIPEVTAGLHFKLGRKEKAMEYQQNAIDTFTKMKLDNEIIKTRLTGNLEKMKQGKPTWIEVKTASTVTK